MVPLSAFKSDSHPPSKIICYDGAWNDGVYKTWEDFLAETALLRAKIETVKGDKWLLHSEDCWYFFLAFTALLQCKKEILISANVSPGYIAEIRGANNATANNAAAAGSTVPFLTDQISDGENDFINIPDLLAGKTSEHSELGNIPAINAEETSIILYTSGSTGEPKAVRHRLSGLENDYFFKVSEWGEEYLKRKICTTVSQHHFYGLSSAILLPFAMGVPFRRKRIDFPEELEKMKDSGYAIFTVPAFLKRAVDTENTSA